MSLSPATRLGPYEIVAPLGAGGMGEVYRAKDSRLGREVAIKVLPAEVASDPERLRRFEQEAKAASAIHHPNLLTVFDVGNESGVAYLVTELLAGESLRELLRRGPVPPKRTVEIATQLARGLAAAHDKGIVHRDLKPENLFLTRDGAAKILDFGLARMERPELSAVDSHDASTVLETSAGTVLGTVGYMAPEQVRGERADARSDLFSLGVVLHEMLAGSNPFRRDSVVESLHAILKEEAPDLASTPSGASSLLGRIVARLLDKEPERRFHSAHDLAFALEEIAGSAPVVATPSVSRPRRAQLVAVSLALAVALAAAVWLVRSRGGSTPGAPIRSLAVLPFANLSRGDADDYFSDGMTDALSTELAHISALKVIARNSAARFKDSPKSPAEMARELGVEALVSGSVLRAGDRVRISAQLAEASTDRVLWAQGYERAVRDVLSLQREVASAIAGAIALELSPAEQSRLGGGHPVNPRALDEYLRGRALWNQRTEAETRQALAHFEQATKIDPSFALPFSGVADCYILLAAYSWMEPRTASPLARAAAERAIELDPTAGEPHASLGDLVYHFDRDFQRSLAEHDRALELSPGYAVAYYWKAEPVLALGRVEEGVALLRRAVELDPFTPFPHSFLGLALARNGRGDEARAELRRALELSPEFSTPRQLLVRLSLDEGRTEEAIAAAREMVAKDPSPGHLALLGIALAIGSREAEARSLLARLDAASDPRAWASSLPRAALEAALGDRAAALRDLRAAIDAHDFIVPSLLYSDRIEFRRLAGDPAFEQLMAEIRSPR